MQIQARVTAVGRKGERCGDTLMGLGSQQELESGMGENDRQGPRCLQPRCLSLGSAPGLLILPSGPFFPLHPDKICSWLPVHSAVLLTDKQAVFFSRTTQ